MVERRSMVLKRDDWTGITRAEQPHGRPFHVRAALPIKSSKLLHLRADFRFFR